MYKFSKRFDISTDPLSLSLALCVYMYMFIWVMLGGVLQAAKSRRSKKKRSKSMYSSSTPLSGHSLLQALLDQNKDLEHPEYYLRPYNRARRQSNPGQLSLSLSISLSRFLSL